MPHRQHLQMQSAAMRRQALFRVPGYHGKLITGEKSPAGDPKPQPKSNPNGQPQPRPLPPDAIPDPLPGVDPQQTPGTDRPPMTGM